MFRYLFYLATELFCDITFKLSLIDSCLPTTKGYLYVGSLDTPFSAIKVFITNIRYLNRTF